MAAPVPPHQPPTPLIELADELLTSCITHYHDTRSDEVFQSCLACGEWEGHTDSCFVPALEKWMNEPATPPLRGTRRNPDAV